MTQRMGRTGRKNEGRFVVLACEGSELKGYLRKQAKSKAVDKLLRMNSFNYHSSPRMVPHVFKPEVQFLKISVNKFVPRGKKDYKPVSVLAYKTRLTDSETDLLAKYFASTSEIPWRPSLIAFPHFQTFPSPVNKLLHSSRTGILIDTMQYLQGLTFANGSETVLAEDEDISDPCLGAEAVEPHDEMTEDSESSNGPAEDILKTEVVKPEIELEKIAKDMYSEDIHKQKPCLHALLFGSEFVSVDEVGKVLILSLPQLPLESNSKRKIGDSVASEYLLMHDSEDHEENTMQAKGNPSPHSRTPELENLLESSLCNPEAEKGKLLPGAEEILCTPVSSRMPKERDTSCEDHNVMHDRMITLSPDESSNDIDSEFSPRLTNFIKSGIVPESPINNSGTWNGDGGDFSVPAIVLSPALQTEFSMKSLKHDEKALLDGSFSEMDVPCLTDNDIQKDVLPWNNSAPRAFTSPIPVDKEMQTPKLSNSSSSKDWLLDSGVKPETVEQQCKFRRLRKLGDLNRKFPSESRERNGPNRKHRSSRGTGYRKPAKLVRGEKKQANDVAVYIEEEAEVSSEIVASDDEEDDQDNSSYEDSFIDDGASTAAAGTHAGDCRTDMMAIYRRSLLSQSPFQRLPDSATKSISPDSVVQSSRMDGSGSSSGAKHDDTPQTCGLDSTNRNPRFTCNGAHSVMDESTLDSRKRKLSFYQAQSVPMVNLNKEFSLISEAAGENSSMQIQEERAEENIIDIFEDDKFFEGIDLDAVEEEATKLLRCKSECSVAKTAMLSQPIQQSVGVLGAPSFDLGI